MGSSISFRSLLSILLLAGCLLSTQAAAAPHPSLLFDEADIPKIRARLDGPLRQVRDALVSGIRFPYTGGDFPKHPNLNWYLFSDRRSIADTLLAFSFGATFLDPSTQAGREARELAHNYLTGICRYHDWVFPETQDGPDPDLNSAHFLFAVSMAYDWLYHSLPESERRICRDKVAHEGDKVYRAMLREAWWMPDLLQNHNWINTASLGVAALAFEGELSGVDTSRWLAAVEENLEKVHFVLDQIEGGAWHEGTGYLNYGLDSLIPFSIALERRHGGPNYADNTIVRDYPKLRRFMMPPAQHHRRGYVLWGDFSGLDNENTLLSVFYAARKGWDPHAGWYAKQYLEGALPNRSSFTAWPPGQRGLLIASIVYDENMSVVPPPEGRAWDLDYFAKDLSLWTSRSGWSDGGSLLAFKNGVFGGHANFNRLSQGDVWPGGSINFGHDHADDMGVHFFADGEWLTTRVPGYWIGRDNGAPQVNRTRYANSLLVDDRGQLGEGLRTCWMRSCPWFFERIGTINHVGSTAHYSYALGAGSQLYPRDMELQTFGRSVLFVERNIPVIRDVVRARSSRRFEIVYHAMDGVARDGDWIRLHAKNGRALGVKVVAPAEFETRTEAQHAVHLNKFDPDGSMTAVMIRPRQQSASTTFLTALAPVRAQNWGSGRPSITALDPAVPETGLRIRGLAPGEEIDVAFNEAPSHTVSAAGLEVTGMAGVRKTRGGEVVRVMLAVGNRLALDGRTWLEVLSPEPATVELDFSEHGLSVTGDAAPIRVYAPGVREVLFNGEPVAFSRSGDTIQIPPADEEDPGEDPGPGAPGDEEPGDGGDDDEGQGGAPGCGGCNAGGSGGSGGTPGSGGCWGSGGAGGSDDEPDDGSDETGDDPGAGGAGGSDGGDDGSGDDGSGGADGSDGSDDENGAGGTGGSDEGDDGGSGGSGGAGGSDGTGDDEGSEGDDGDSDGSGGAGGSDDTDGSGGSGGSDGSSEPPGAGGAGGDDLVEEPDDEGSGGAGGDGARRGSKSKKKGLFRCSAGSASQASPLGLTLLALTLGSRRRRAD